MIEFRILGLLEVADGDELLQLGGPKQRAVLAALLLRPERVVSVQQLIDEVWGEQPPESAAHSLEAYISRIRSTLGTGGPSVARRGNGYVLELGDATLDAQRFAELAAAAVRAADPARASELAGAALALWRGPALAEVALGPLSRAEAERLEEARLSTLEQRFEAELGLGRDERAVSELQTLAAQHPYRERFVAQLMLALYRSGRHADALKAYESLRMRLAADLGLQPSEELQQLSGRIVRQEPELARPPEAPHAARAVSGRPRTLALGAGAALALALAFTASGSASQRATGAPTASATRVALVLPQAPGAADSLMTLYRNKLGFVTAGQEQLTRRVIVAKDAAPATVAAVASQLRVGRFGLVLWVGDGPAARAFAPLVRTMPATKFVYIDASMQRLSLQGAKNASAIRFAEEETSDLVGYLSGLVAPRGRPAQERADLVSFVGAVRTPQLQLDLARFRRGLHAALPYARVLVGYSGDAEDRTPCERIANDHINRGADVVFVLAGRCGTGAVAVARTRGVWAVGSDESFAQSAHSNVLARTYKEHDWAVGLALSRFLRGTLPRGRDLVLGLDDDYAVGILDMNPEVAPAADSKVVLRCSDIRQHAPSDLG